MTQFDYEFNDEEMEIIYDAAMFGLDKHFDEIADYLDIDDHELEVIKKKLFDNVRLKW